MKKILIAYDGSPGATTAIDDLRYAGLPPNTTTARIITIADMWLGFWDRRYEKAVDLLGAATEISQEGACRACEFFHASQVSSIARAGPPAAEILAEANRWSADLIVIGSHSRTHLSQSFLGSVSQKIASDAHCSVRIARPHASLPSTSLSLLAALDGPTDSDKVVEELIGRHWPAETKVDLVTVLNEKLKSRWVGLEESVEALHKKSLAKFAARNVPAKSHIIAGDPKSTILKVASEWDVASIFLGARALDRGNKLYFETLASAIGARAHCTVEVVRPNAEYTTPGPRTETISAKSDAARPSDEDKGVQGRDSPELRDRLHSKWSVAAKIGLLIGLNF
jgi:nucleotide-binding universal stress UspA family protein